MSIPEPDKFTLEEIVEQWSKAKIFKHSISTNFLHRLEESGKLEILTERNIDFESGPLDTISAIGERLKNATYTYSNFITKDERDRFEREHQTNDLEKEPTPKTKGAYLRLIGYMAERLAETDNLAIAQPYPAAEKIIEYADLAGKSVGSRSSIGSMLQDAIEVWEES